MDVPVAAQQANVTFQLYQPDNTDVDNYGITNIRYFAASSSANQTHVEFLRVVSTPRISTAPYYIIAEREPFGTFTGVRNDHPDNTPIYKCNVQFDATGTTEVIDAEGNTENVYLAEFGGNINTDDYVIIGRRSTTPDVEPIVYDVGEVFQVKTTLEQTTKTFVISSNCDGGPENDVFTVNSVTGDTFIAGNTIINNSITIGGGCGTLSDILFTGDASSGTNVISNLTVTSIGKTLADIKKGDVISVITDGSPLKMNQDTAVDFIFGGAIYLTQPIIGSTFGSGVLFKASRNEKLTTTDGKGNTTFDVDTCTGTTTIGSHAGRFDVNLAWSSLGSINNNAAIEQEFENNLDDYIAYGYYADPQSIAENGPNTTIISTATGNSATELQITVQSLGEGTGKFASGDLIAVGPLSSFSTNTGQLEFMIITEVFDGTNVIVATREQEGSVAMSHVSGDVVRRVIKHQTQSSLIDSEIRQRNDSGSIVDYLSVIIERGYISQQKLDYKQWLRFRNTSTGTEILTAVNGRLYGKIHTVTNMNEQLGDGAKSYRNGSLDVTDNLTLTGGNFVIYDSVKQTKLFQFVNDDGHADHSGLINWDAGVVARGDIFLYPTSCPENVLLDLDCVPSFSVDNLGNVTAKTTLKVTGTAAVSPTTDDVFSVQNLGVNGGSEFTVKQDRSIDAFGITNFATSSGARHTRYLSAASPEADLTLIANIVYMVNVQNTQTLILTLPTAPQTGDVVRIIDVGGNLKYDTTLVVRTAESSGLPIQGDSLGTLFGDRLTPYPSGELVVQTPNAAFALIYLGSQDNNGQIGIPTSVQGWWLMEV